jgi:hypothetical protein
MKMNNNKTRTQNNSYIHIKAHNLICVTDWLKENIMSTV